MGQNSNITTTQRFWELISIEKTDIYSIYFYAALQGMLQLSVPIGIQAIIGFVLGASMVTSIYVLIFMVVMGVFIVGVLQLNQMRIIEGIQQKIFARYAFDLTEKIPQLDLYKTDDYNLPEKVNRFFDTLTLQKGFSKILLDIPTAIIQIIFGLLLLSFYHPFFIAFSFFLTLLLWLMLYFTSKKGLETSIKESTYKYQVVGWMEEVAKSIKSFKISQDSDYNIKTIDNKIVNYLLARTQHFLFLTVQYKSLLAFKTIITATLLGVGVYLLLNQQLNIGEFIAAEIVILSVIASVEKIIKNLDTVYDVFTALEKLASVTEGYTEECGKLELASNNIELELINSNFKYHNSNAILKNINLKIPPNSSVCILGEENSGKTTFLKFLSFHYLNYEGDFIINNIPFKNYDIKSLRKKTGIYFFSNEIFSGTVLDNITMGRTEVSPENIILLAEELGFHNLLQDLPLGFETNIYADGKQLPKTILQKILILRALVNSPKLLIMEQPWQGLDDVFKGTISNYILDKKRNHTLVVASNDAEFAKKCNYIFELINGELKPVV